MRALDPEVVDAVWAAIEPLVPRPNAENHPVGSIYSFSPLTWSFTRRQCVGYDHR